MSKPIHSDGMPTHGIGCQQCNRLYIENLELRRQLDLLRSLLPQYDDIDRELLEFETQGGE